MKNVVAQCYYVRYEPGETSRYANICGTCDDYMTASEFQGWRVIRVIGVARTGPAHATRSDASVVAAG